MSDLIGARNPIVRSPAVRSPAFRRNSDESHVLPPEGGTTNGLSREAELFGEQFAASLEELNAKLASRTHIVRSPAFRRNSHERDDMPPEGGTTSELFGEHLAAILEELNARLAA